MAPRGSELLILAEQKGLPTKVNYRIFLSAGQHRLEFVPFFPYSMQGFKPEAAQLVQTFAVVQSPQRFDLNEPDHVKIPRT